MSACLGEKKKRFNFTKMQESSPSLVYLCSVPINRSCSWIPFKSIKKSILEKQWEGIIHLTLLNLELVCSFFEKPHLLPLQCSGTK